MSEYLLEVKNLKMHFPVYGGIFRRQTGKVHAVDGVSLKIKKGKQSALSGNPVAEKRRLEGLSSGFIIYQGVRFSSKEITFPG